MKILHVVGARPNFMKAAPVIRALENRGVQQVLVHTGQHYDKAMSEVFFQELGMREPDLNLQVGSGTQAEQTATIMMRFEPVLDEEQPDATLVYGDVNSTVAAALVCAKKGQRLAHVEAGLRSFDRSMPEEINRIVTDRLADFLFTPSADGDKHLVAEGVDPERIFLVGNVMIDTLTRLLPIAAQRIGVLRKQLGLESDDFCVVTLHRPSNVDDQDRLRSYLSVLDEYSRKLKAVFPVHPRTKVRIAAGLAGFTRNMVVTDPLSYLDFLCLQMHSRLVITDSGGVQEETTYLGIPCFTLRDNTERPITTDVGTNVLIGTDVARLREELARFSAGTMRRGAIPRLWDGHASDRIADILVKKLAC